METRKASTDGNSNGPVWLFAGLAALNVASVLAAVWLCHLLVVAFAGSVGTNRAWAERAAGFAQLSQTATRANAPGNDVFENHDVAGERARLHATYTEYQQIEDHVRGSLQAIPAADRAPLTAELDRAHVSMAAMVAEAEAIFAAFERHDDAEAGRHMATMDRRLADTGEHLGALTSASSALQQSAFALQSADAQRLGVLAWSLVGAVAVLVGLVLAYGRVLSRKLRASQDAINQRNADMRRLLDHAAQGFATVDLRGAVPGRLSEERSAAFDRLLGAVPPSGTLQDVLGAISPDIGEFARMGLEAVREGFLPTELTLEQLPRAALYDGRNVRLSYRPIGPVDAPDALLVVASDVTSEQARERAEEESREATALFTAISSDKAGVREFVGEADTLMRYLQSDEHSLVSERRFLHTLKGSCALFGLARFSRLCHDLEGAALDRGGKLEASEREALRDAWTSTSERIRGMLGDGHDTLIEVEASEHARMIGSVLSGAPADEIATEMATWTLERSGARLARVGEHARSLAKRLGKGELSVEIRPNDVRLSPERLARFWSELSHVIRNAVDHGIEESSERIEKGKTPNGQLQVATQVVDSRLFIEIQDDGRGIDWDLVRRRAVALGMPARTHDDLVECLFAQGFSTREVTTELSGRGVGLAAVREAVLKLGGTIEVDTQKDHGTTFRFCLPYADPEDALRTFTVPSLQPTSAAA